jgi:glycosyltransferase involved in cell wall biosynthesis
MSRPARPSKALPAAEIAVSAAPSLHFGARGGIKAVIVIRRVGPYHLARLEALHRRLGRGLFVVEVCRSDATYEWDAVHRPRYMRGTTLFDDDIGSRDPRALRDRVGAVLDRERPSVVAIPGWSDPAALASLAWCLRRRVPSVMMSDSTRWDEPRHPLKEAVKRQIVGMASAGFVAGSAQRDYLASLGMAAERIELGYDVVDNAHFAARARDAGGLDALARRLGVAGPFFLACCRFVEKKNLLRLVDAYARYRERTGTWAWQLVLVGDGPQREAIERRIAERGLGHLVRLAGFVQYDMLPRYYAAAGALILASTTEQWGLVVNEAMAAGLPVLVSERCGCCADLVIDGHNGFRFDPFDIEAMAGRMLTLAHGGVDRGRLGENSARLIGQWTTARFAEGFLAAAQKAAAAKPMRLGGLKGLALTAILRLGAIS